MSAVLGRLPTNAELAERLGMEPLDVMHLLGELQAVNLSSLETRVSREWETSGSEVPPADPFLLCLREEIRAYLSDAIAGLGEREKQVLTLYYADELTMKEVGAVLGIGESRVSQIHSAAISRLRGRLQVVAETELPA